MASHSVEQHLTEAMASINEVLWSFRFSDRKLTYVSPAVERVYGYPPEAFYSNPRLWLDCIFPEDKPRVLAFAAGLSQGERTSIHYRIVRADGAIRWLRYTVHITHGETRETRRANSIGSDVTEEYLLQESLRRSHRALRALHDCKNKISVAEDEYALLQGICEVVVQAGYILAWAGMLQDGGKGITLNNVAGQHQAYIENIRELLATDMRRLNAIDRALRTQRPAKTNNFARNGYLPWRHIALGYGLHSVAALPLVHDTQVLGILNVYATEKNAFDQEELDLLEHLAQNVMEAIQSLRNREQRIAAEAALHLRQRAIEASANAIVIASATRPDYPIEYVNPAFERMTGYTTQDIVGKSLRILHRNDAQQPGLAEIRRILSERRDGHATMRNYRKDGTLFWSTVHISPVMDSTGQVSHFVAAKYDVTETKRYQDELETQANYDALTGLANRKLLYKRLRRAMSTPQDSKPFWVAFLDLDRFKLINDSLGHRAGDQLLQQIATRLQHTLREGDTLARLGGDEFVLVLPAAISDTSPVQVLESIMHAIIQPLRIDGHNFYTTCSIGVALYPEDGADPDTLIKHADTAMYHAKETGRNNFQLFTPELKAKAFRRMRLESDLRRAVEKDEFVLHYQPQISLKSGKICGMEVLIRWQHPELGMIAPDQFIDLAEDTGLIIPIGHWVIRNACRQSKIWQEDGLAELTVSVNLSARQLYEKGLIESIGNVLSDTAFDPRYLGIEITENIAMTNVDQTIDTLRTLKELGLQLSIDDFGTGYSSLSYLTQFPIDMLKIDQTFVHDITAHSNSAAVVSSIITLAHNLRLEVIAEGVETEAQLKFLQSNGCDLMQGYYFSKPLPADEFECLLRRHAGIGEIHY